jgi:6-phosphogluconolactonase (cycloisomerase 2 family)
MSLIPRFLTRVICLGALITGTACSSTFETDAGTGDGSVSTPDGGAGNADARVPTDTGVRADTGVTPTDTGVVESDTGVTDSGVMDSGPDTPPENVLYVGSNIPQDNQNSILGYRRAMDGTLTALPGSPYLTGGKGTGNPTAVLGVNDASNQIIASADKKFLFATNQGSNSIAVMRVRSDGSLTPVPGSPFPSGGVQPVSLQLASPTRLWVAHKNQDPTRPGNSGQGYHAFNVAADGSLTAVPTATFESRSGSSPAELWITADKSIMFATDMFNPLVNPAMGSLRAFTFAANGTLVLGPNSPLEIPTMGNQGPPVVLGLVTHPSAPVLYVGLPTREELQVVEYDANARLTLGGTETSSGGVAICWLTINRAGSRVYAANSGDNSISVFNTSNPRDPVVIQHLVQKEGGPGGFAVVPPSPNIVSSQVFNIGFTPDERFLYAVNERVTTDSSYTEGNNIHVHTVGGDGRLTETSFSPIDLPVPVDAFPAGLVIW